MVFIILCFGCKRLKKESGIKSLTSADVKVADPNRSGGDGRLTSIPSSSTFLSVPSLLPKSMNGTTGIPALRIGSK